MLIEQKPRPVERLEPQSGHEDQIRRIARMNQVEAALGVDAARQAPL